MPHFSQSEAHTMFEQNTGRNRARKGDVCALLSLAIIRGDFLIP